MCVCDGAWGKTVLDPGWEACNGAWRARDGSCDGAWRLRWPEMPNRDGGSRGEVVGGAAVAGGWGLGVVK